jgi:hypothetical protein
MDQNKFCQDASSQAKEMKIKFKKNLNLKKYCYFFLNLKKKKHVQFNLIGRSLQQVFLKCAAD